MTSQADPWFLSERAEHLAVVLLTRISNLRIEKRAIDEGVDFLVTIKGGRAPGRMFGVEVKATQAMSRLVDVNHRLRPQFAAKLRRQSRDYPFPIGVLVFDVSTGTGRFGWVLSPSVNAAGHAALAKQYGIPTIPANEDSIRKAVKDVAVWYSRRQ